jgi:hypothetical protein
MPRRFTMAAMRLRAQQRSTMENDDSIESSEWNGIFSEIYGDLYSVVASSGMRYFEYVKSYTTTGVNTLAEPADHLATIDTIEYVDSSGQRRRLTQITPAERARWAGQTGTAQVWELVDDTFYLYPTPPAGQTFEVRYIAQPPDLTTFADTDVIDVVTPDGEAFLVWGAVVLALAKSKEDVTLAMQRQAEARARLAEWAAMRAFELPKRTHLDRYDDGSRSALSDHDLFWMNR